MGYLQDCQEYLEKVQFSLSRLMAGMQMRTNGQDTTQETISRIRLEIADIEAAMIEYGELTGLHRA
jgi:hypothetical protein